MSNRIQEERPQDQKSRDQQVFDLLAKPKETDSKINSSRIMTSDLKKTIKSPDHFIFIFSIERKLKSWLPSATKKANLMAVHR